MKTFADWTDEIRALMNPPAPMADTCNLGTIAIKPRITAWDLAEGIDKIVVGARPMTELGRGTAILDALEKLGGNEAFNGRRTGKSRLQMEWYKVMMEVLANTDSRGIEEGVMAHDGVTWGFNPDGKQPYITVVDEVSSAAASTPNAQAWVYLMAPSHAQARAYALKNKLPKTWRYIHMDDQLRGLRNCRILSVGDWTTNKDYEQIARITECLRVYEIEVEYV
jgi:hypothetical protein